jgi:hypothetical protein
MLLIIVFYLKIHFDVLFIVLSAKTFSYKYLFDKDYWFTNGILIL